MVEVWKPVPGYEGRYEASDQGNIRSVDRELVQSNGVKRFFPGKMLKFHLDRDGYHFLSLYGEGGFQRCWKAHRVIALTFLGFSDLPVDHVNGIKTDNRVINLRYVGVAENTRLYHAKGPKGEEDTRNCYYRPKDQKWVVSISNNGVKYYLGFYSTIEDARLFRDKFLKLKNIQL